MDVYTDVFGTLRYWYGEVRDTDHGRLYVSQRFDTKEAAERHITDYVKRNGLNVQPKPFVVKKG